MGVLMTMPHLMNCEHSKDWCLDCVKRLHDEKELIQSALKACRAECQKRGITSAEFAKMCGLSRVQLTVYTGATPTIEPDFVEHERNVQS